MLTATSKPGEFSGTLPECNRVPGDALLEEASRVSLLVTVELNVGVSVEPSFTLMTLLNRSFFDDLW